MRAICWGTLTAATVAITGLLFAFPNHVYSRTIFSIPHAFNPEHTVYGQGQGTRRYLWSESPRVLFEHRLTLARQDRDQQDLIAHVPDTEPRANREDSVLRQALVWPFGIGIETYRYAFMSHKSKKLEALDPMTNHDNPHNNYLYILASCGILGLLSYLWLLSRLISTAWKRFMCDRAPLISGEGAIVERISEQESSVRLETPFARELGPFLTEAHPGLTAQVEGTKTLILGGMPKEQINALLESARFPRTSGRAERALAFGVVTSFISYAVYSIAGFDSVACSVFLYFLLGCAAVLFSPAEDEEPRTIVTQILRNRGIDRPAPVWATLLVAVVMFPLLLHTMWAVSRVEAAEHAFVAEEARTY
jgi:hypothetical protein